MSATPPLIRRCRWCLNRIKQVRYFIDGEWVQVFSVQHLMGDVQITDGLCPDCEVEWQKQLKANPAAST